jgi:hypothetical protein
MSPLIDFDSLATGTVLFEQLPGVRFPSLPRVVVPAAGAASGVHGLSNAQPGEEFNTGPLVIEFLTPQRFVRLLAGLDHASDAPVQATLRAFDASGALVAQQGPAPVGPGPSPVATVLQVEDASARIVRATLEYSGAFTEVIDDLEFSTAGPDAPQDTTAPVVTLIQPAAGTIVTADLFILEAEIVEDRQLRSVTLSLVNDGGSESLPISFSGVGPTFRIGPVRTGPLSQGSNAILLTAEDFAGNVGTASFSIGRAPIEGTLELVATEPVVCPRMPSSIEIAGALQETFPGSLDGRERLTIAIVSPAFVSGRVELRDPLNDPDTRFTLPVLVARDAPLGSALLTIEAIDEVSQRTLDSLTLTVSITPANAIGCLGSDETPFYQNVPLARLTARINSRIELELSGDGAGVNASDSDVGLPLVALSAREKFVDADGDGRFSPGEAIYADRNGAGVVSVGDERLANPPVGEIGSIVGPNDADVGRILVRFAADEKFVDTNENGRLDGALPEPVYRDRDDSGTVSEDDVRLAKTIVQRALVTKTPMNVQYRDDQFGAGLINIQQQYVARPPGFFEADILFIATLRVFLDGFNTNPDRLRFEYAFILVKADPTGGPLDPLIAGAFEDGFRRDFAEPFRAQLGPAIAAEIRTAAEAQGIDGASLLVLLKDVRITDREFALGFCVPSDEFPGLGANVTS